MAATTTLAALLARLAEETGLGLVISAGTGATTSITETDTGVSELRGPFTGAKIAIGSPVTVITDGTVGEDTYVSNFTAGTTGVVTLSPAITTAATGFIIWKPVVQHGKNVEKAVNRANEKCRRWMMVPLTYVPDGEMLAATASDYWTASAGTASYQSLATPEIDGRVIQISHSSAANAQSNTIPARAGEVWEFETSIRATSDADSATFTVRDITASDVVSLTFEIGDGVTTSRAFETQKGTFTVPGSVDADARIAFRIAVSGSAGTMTAQMAPLIAYPRDARSFPFTNRLTDVNRIGNYFRSEGISPQGGPDERGYSQALTIGGREVSYSHVGDHLVATFNFAPGGPTYYEELVHGSSLSAMTDTTVFPAEMVMKWARAEIYDFLMRADALDSKRLDNGTLAPSPWLKLRNAAYQSAKQSNYEPELKQVVGRR